MLFRTVAFLLLSLIPASLRSQSPTPGEAHQPVRFETRAQLESEARAAESQGRQAEAWLLRTRLAQGDFQEGDRILVAFENLARMDTAVVRAGKVLQFRGMDDLSLQGVLRSELNDTLRGHLARYLRNPTVRATPLLAVAVLGQVGQQGYFYVPADLLLRDVIMRAGGPAANADLSKTTIRRGAETIWTADDIRVALADGLSIDQLHLRAGDEIHVPERRRTQWGQVLTVTASAVALLTTLIVNLSR